MRANLMMLGLITLMACQNKDQSQSQETSGNQANEQSAQTVIDFLKWYKVNYDSINRFDLVNGSGSFDSTIFYSVNFAETEKYLAKLNSGGFVSSLYLEDWRQYFLEHEENFKKNPINDGPPDGFEYDFVLLTQEIDETLSAIDNPKIIEVRESDEGAIVKINIMMRLGFSLKKNDNKWVIDKIENLGLKSNNDKN